MQFLFRSQLRRSRYEFRQRLHRCRCPIQAEQIFDSGKDKRGAVLFENLAYRLVDASDIFGHLFLALFSLVSTHLAVKYRLLGRRRMDLNLFFDLVEFCYFVDAPGKPGRMQFLDVER